MLDLSAWSLTAIIGLFLAATIVIGYAGSKLTRFADILADRTGMGEALTGAVLLGAGTSLPGTVTTMTAAWNGHAEFAVSHGMGGIAVQTLFLSVADMTYRRANLEHAAASQENILQAGLLIALLSLNLMAMVGPEVTFRAIHPASLILVVSYLLGQRIVYKSKSEPMWWPKRTKETRQDVPHEENRTGQSLPRLWLSFLGLAAAVGAAGWLVAETGTVIAERTGLSQTIVGGLFATLSTSLPELVTSLAAVRQGALVMAVGGILGGNAYDALFTAMADVFYRGGSIYHALTEETLFLVTLAILMTSLLVMGMVRRQEKGFGKIGFESLLVVIVYAAGFLAIFFAA